MRGKHFGLGCRVAAVLIPVALMLAAAICQADIPQRINYQGRLLDSSTGEPITGAHSVIFRIYDASSGGTLLWSETQGQTADTSGVFAAVLGSTTPITIDFDGPCWLEVQVDGQTLSPRRELVSVPFAYRASDSDNLGGLPPSAYTASRNSLDASDGNPVDALYVDASGRVGISTTTPTNFLDVRAFGGAEGGVSPYGEVLAHFRTTGSDAHSAISIDGQPGRDAILYFAQDGASMWDLRNDADAGDKFQLRWHRGASNVKPVTIDTTGYIGVFTTTPNGPLHVESGISINSGTRFADRSAPIVVGDGDGTAPCILIDGNQIEQAKTDDLIYINYNSSADVAIAQGGGNVGIGTASPAAKLEVAGQVKITGGSPGEGKVLTSSSAGLGTWQSITTEYYICPIKALPLNNPTDFTLSPSGGNLLVDCDIDDSEYIQIPIDIPGKISGVRQRIESITVYYQAGNGNKIESTQLVLCGAGGGFSLPIQDTTDRTSTTMVSYTLTDPTPDSINGTLSLRLGLSFTSGSYPIYIGNIIIVTTD